MTQSASAAGPTILLVDNGSLAPAAVMNLRAITARLGCALGRKVEPVSVLHSDTIPAGELEGQPAEILEAALERRLRCGITDFLVAPLFFGPSGALIDYLPQRVAALQARFKQLRVRVGPPLVDPADPRDQRMAAILEDRVRTVLPAGGAPPAVILVDHGSPVRAVAAVRDHLAAQLRARLGSTARGVLAASMERRDGPEYAFNEPLLERALAQPGFDSGLLVVALLFFRRGVMPARAATSRKSAPQPSGVRPD